MTQSLFEEGSSFTQVLLRHKSSNYKDEGVNFFHLQGLIVSLSSQIFLLKHLSEVPQVLLIRLMEISFPPSLPSNGIFQRYFSLFTFSDKILLVYVNNCKHSETLILMHNQSQNCHKKRQISEIVKEKDLMPFPYNQEISNEQAIWQLLQRCANIFCF